MLGLAFLGPPITNESNAQLLDLLFFKDCNTIEKQQMLKRVISFFVSKAAPDNGGDFMPLYLFNSFRTNKLKLHKKYTAFFHDVDLLAPGLLTKVDPNQKTDRERYKKYCQLLPRMCNRWYVNKGSLPPLNEWTTKKYIYQVDEKKRMEIQLITIELLKEFEK